jgi:hypothetical protein
MPLDDVWRTGVLQHGAQHSAVITIRVSGAGPIRSDELVERGPTGQYLFECTDGWFLLWRLTGDEPSDDAFEPAASWPWLATEAA